MTTRQPCRRPVFVLLVYSLTLPMVASAAWISPSVRASRCIKLALSHVDDSAGVDGMTRRSLFRQGSCVAGSFLTISGWPTSDALAIVDSATTTARPNDNVDNDNDTAVGMVSTSTVADRLRIVPTFTIVDAKGVPYMVVGEDAKVTAYFFTTYDEANRILQLAKKSANQAIQEALQEQKTKQRLEKLSPLESQEQDEIGVVNPWISARISTVPLDFAVTLVAKSAASPVLRKSLGGNYFQVAPAEADVQDALALDKNGRKELPEGKVPLFYFRDYTIQAQGGVKQSPLYFRKSELISDWKANNASKDVPQVLATELFSVLTEMVKPGGTDEDLQTLVFMPPKESAKKAKDCLKAGGKETPFQLGQRIIVL